jgi:hypothetical protein
MRSAYTAPRRIWATVVVDAEVLGFMSVVMKIEQALHERKSR